MRHGGETDRLSRCSASRAMRSRLDVVVRQYAQRGAVHVLVLTGPQRPQERRKARQPEHERRRHQIDQHIHDALNGWRVRWSVRASPSATLRERMRRAFSVTRTEEPDIAAAAISGVTNPAIAIGTAITL